MVHLVITHGRAQEFSIPADIARQLEEATRWGLQRVGAPFFADIPVTLAFYGDYWRPDTVAPEGAAREAPPAPTALQRDVAADMLAAAASPGGTRAGVEPEGIGWSSLNGFATFLDQHLHLGDLVVRYFLEDVETYFADPRLHALAIGRVAEAVAAANDEVVLLGHSLGSVVAYDAVRERPDLPVRGFITLGSPLGLPTILRRLPDRVFPPGVARWANVFDPNDFVTGKETLRPHYPAADGRAVEDLQTEGRPPGLTHPIAPHDGTVYLSSIALATALRAMAEAASASAADALANPLRPGRVVRKDRR